MIYYAYFYKILLHTLSWALTRFASARDTRPIEPVRLTQIVFIDCFHTILQNNFLGLPFIQALVCDTDMISVRLLTGFVAIFEYRLDIAMSKWPRSVLFCDGQFTARLRRPPSFWRIRFRVASCSVRVILKIRFTGSALAVLPLFFLYH